MRSSLYLLTLPLASFAYGEVNNANITLEEIDVTSSSIESPHTILLTPKQSLQPIPSADAAAYLKYVPNMSVIRKGGASGDPLFRGLGGSRLAITASDSYIFGGCGGRMDPPTAYIFPESYDQVIITKGPQTVTQGMGNIAGAIAFGRTPYYFNRPTVQGNATAVVGSFGRYDLSGEMVAGDRLGYLRLNGIVNQSKDYHTGNHEAVHSAYKRNSQNITLGFTPSEDTTLELGYDRSRGQASYADRGMDGSQFDRDAWHIMLEQRNLTYWLNSIKFNYGHSYIDHVMDNYRLRTKSQKAKMFMASNPDRITDTFSLSAELQGSNHITQLGVDYMKDTHRARMGMGMMASKVEEYKTKPRDMTQKFHQYGIYVENDMAFNQHHIISGIRYDRVSTTYSEKSASQKLLSPQKDYALVSGFGRYEFHDEGKTYFIGLGHAKRTPDFWERNNAKNKHLNAEANTELDVGLVYNNNQLSGSVTAFASEIHNFILIDRSNTDPKVATARNIKARRYGVETDLAYQFHPNWKVGTSLAYTYGKNKTDNHPLAQTPPLETKTYLSFDNQHYSISAIVRGVAAQNRFAKKQGNIVGLDVDKTAGFATVSLNASWKPTQIITLSAGVDNLFNKHYREFVNKGAADVVGYTSYTEQQIYEPGRQYWVKLQALF